MLLRLVMISFAQRVWGGDREGLRLRIGCPSLLLYAQQDASSSEIAASGAFRSAA